MRRKKMLVFFALVLVLALSGCTSSADDTNKDTASVENSAMDAGTTEDSAENRANESPVTDAVTTADGTENPSSNTASTSEEVDYDLTAMSSDMVYALVYQMLYDPDTYIGKTVRMSGQYYASYYSETNQYYHYCIIADATLCCSSGMEFVQGESALVYPDDYPENETEIIVVGTFGTYEELGVTYFCLLDASME